MDYVVALLNQSEFGVFRHRAEVPPGSAVFESPEELARATTKQSLDVIRGRLLGEEVEPSLSTLEAAVRLWHVFGIGAHLKKIDWTTKVRSLTVFGTPKVAAHGQIELIAISYFPGRTHMFDVFFRTLAPQAKKIVKFLLEDGRGLWTRDQYEAVVAAREAELDSIQGWRKVLTYYQPALFSKKMIRRVSLEEFARRPEFAGISLLDRQVLEKDQINSTPKGLA